MPWTYPYAWVAGDTVAASLLNLNVNTDVRLLANRPGFFLESSAAKSLSYLDVGVIQTSVFTPIASYREEGLLNWSFNDGATGVVIHQPGLWTFGAQYSFSATTTYGGVLLTMWCDAYNIAYKTQLSGILGNSTALNMQIKSAPFSLNAGQEIVPKYFLFDFPTGSAGCPTNLAAANYYSVNFWGHQVRES